MKTGLGVAMGALVLAHAMTVMACAQSPNARGVQGETVREIDDPHTGDRWLLMRNDEFPGGPGRLVLAAGQRDTGGRHLQLASQREEAVLHPVIRAGDRLIVEEHTAIVDAVLEARALGPAALGSRFNVRLAIGGRVMRAVALGPGRAILQPEEGVRP